MPRNGSRPAWPLHGRRPRRTGSAAPAGSCTSTPQGEASASPAARSAARPARGSAAGRPYRVWSRCSSRARGDLLLYPLVTLLLQLFGELLAAGSHDSSVCEDVDEIGHQVTEKELVMRDHEHRVLLAAQGVDAAGHDAQRVDVEAGVGLVEDGQLGV